MPVLFFSYAPASFNSVAEEIIDTSEDVSVDPVEALDIVEDTLDDFTDLFHQHLEDLQKEYDDVLNDSDDIEIFDMLMMDTEIHLDQEDHQLNSFEELSQPIFPGSSTTVGMSLYSIISYAVKNKLRLGFWFLRLSEERVL